ncbi:MAG: tetratricopeptide repeat protein [Bacteroidia bacterium]|nr:tetratricopeptide repeat protein [Bacteroidia bacterium]
MQKKFSNNRAMAVLFLALINLMAVAFVFSQNRIPDSLNLVLKNAQHDTSRIKALMELGNYFQSSEPDSSIYFHTQARLLAEKISDKTNPNAKDDLRIAEALRRTGWDHYVLGNNKKALSLYDEALEKLEKHLQNETGQTSVQKTYTTKIRTVKAAILGSVGSVYYSEGNYANALQYYFKGLKVKEELGTKNGTAWFLSSIGNVYANLQDYSKATDYYFKALKMDEDLGDSPAIVADLAHIGSVYGQQNEYSLALNYYFKALKIAEESGNKNHLATLFGNIGTIYDLQKNYPGALDYYLKSLKMEQELGYKQKIAGSLGNLGSLYTKTGKFAEAEKELKNALTLSTEINALNLISTHQLSLSQLYDTTQRPGLAFIYYKKYIASRDSINSEQNQKKLVRAEMNYEFDKKEAITKAENDKQVALAEEESKNQKIIIWFAVFGFGLVVVVLFVVTRSLRVTRKQKRIIEVQKDEVQRQKTIVEEQKTVVEEKQKEILDSIYYARRIQRALIANEKYIERKLNYLRKKN